MRIAIREETSHLQFHLNSGLQRTHHFLDAKAIACLPHGAIVVNAARGGIVFDEDSLELKSMTVADQDCRVRRFEQIIGNSPALRVVLEQVERVAAADSTVFIQGETGTGKELIARAIHKASPRSGHSLIKLNCAAIPFDLLESELFGHERGAFTGAIAQKFGRFELADKGTERLRAWRVNGKRAWECERHSYAWPVRGRKELLLLHNLTFVFGKKAVARTTDRIAAIKEDINGRIVHVRR